MKVKTKTISKWQLVIGIICFLYGLLNGIFIWMSSATRTDNFIVALLGVGFIISSFRK